MTWKVVHKQIDSTCNSIKHLNVFRWLGGVVLVMVLILDGDSEHIAVVQKNSKFAELNKKPWADQIADFTEHVRTYFRVTI